MLQSMGSQRVRHDCVTEFNQRWEKKRGKMETVIDFSFLASKITAGCECSHEIKICLLLGKNNYDKPSSVEYFSHAQLFVTP